MTLSKNKQWSRMERPEMHAIPQKNLEASSMNQWRRGKKNSINQKIRLGQLINFLV